MELKNLEKSLKKLDKIKSLDAEIIELDKVAQIACQNDCKSTISLYVSNLSNKDKKQDVPTEDGSIKSIQDELTQGWSFLLRGVSPLSSKSEKKSSDHELEYKISEGLLLTIVSVLVYDKKQERMKLINEIKDLGITI